MSEPLTGTPHPGVPLPPERVADRLAITDLVYAYARFVDLADTDAVAALFTEDVVVSYGAEVSGDLRGRPAVAAFLARALAPLTATSHLCGNVEVWFGDEPDLARALTYVTAWHRPRNPERADFTVRAQYHDLARRTPEGWRIAERRFFVLGVDETGGAWSMVPRADRRAEG